MKTLKHIYILIISVLLCSITYGAKELKYPIADIPLELKENSKAVIRTHEINFEIISKDQAILSEKMVISILNENGLDEAVFIEYYDKFSKVKKIKAIVYDEFGKQVKKISGDEITDRSAISGYSIYEDSRMKITDTEFRNYPFTIEYTYEQEFNGFLGFPRWMPFVNYNIGIEKSSFTVSCPNDYDLRYLPVNLNIEPKITEDSGTKTYQWNLSKQKPIKYEFYSKKYNKQDPVLLLAPSEFEIQRTKGNMTTWLDFGKWYYELNSDKGTLKDKAIADIKKVIGTSTDPLEKAQKLYKYLQESKRYVSIQEGIGGWQAISAQEVHDLGYGDCKALVNYMKTILEIADVKSYYSVINSGTFSPDIFTDFPSHQFNHIILCIPHNTDTIWLECTSNDAPFGYLGTFTDNRYALIVTKNGGILKKTKSFGKDVHKSVRSSIVQLDEKGHGIANIESQYTGIFYDRKEHVTSLSDDKKKKYVLRNINIPNINLLNFNYRTEHSEIPSLKENINVELINYATLMHSRLIIPLNLSEKLSWVPKTLSERKTNIYLKRPVQTIDTVCYNIPKGYMAYKTPSTKEFKTEFGEYKASVTIEGNKIYYNRSFVLNSGEYPKEKYNDFYEFLNNIRKADGMKIMLKKQQ